MFCGAEKSAHRDYNKLNIVTLKLCHSTKVAAITVLTDGGFKRGSWEKALRAKVALICEIASPVNNLVFFLSGRCQVLLNDRISQIG